MRLLACFRRFSLTWLYLRCTPISWQVPVTSAELLRRWALEHRYCRALIWLPSKRDVTAERTHVVASLWLNASCSRQSLSSSSSFSAVLLRLATCRSPLRWTRSTATLAASLIAISSPFDLSLPSAWYEIPSERKSQGRFYVGAGGTCPQIHLFPQIQKLADCSEVIYEVPKCSKIQIFRALPRTLLGELTAPWDPLADGEGACCLLSPPKNPTPLSALWASFLLVLGSNPLQSWQPY